MHRKSSLKRFLKFIPISLFLLLFGYSFASAAPLEQEVLKVFAFSKPQVMTTLKLTGKSSQIVLKNEFNGYLLQKASPPVKAPLALQKGDIVDMFSLQESLIYDGLGIPYVDYGFIYGIYIGRQRNPVTISQKSWMWLNLFESTGDVYYYNYFFNCVQWLIDNAKAFNEGLILPYKFEYPPYGLKPEWYSAMAQGQAIETMVYAYRQSKNTKYLEVAKKLLKPLWVEVNKGGVTVKLSDTAYWYEEFASKSIEPPMVLNGNIFCLFGVYTYYLETNDPEAKTLFDYGINALLATIDKFDFNGWTYYDLKKKVSTDYYHSVHVSQMKRLYEITGNEKFLYYYERWKSALESKIQKAEIFNPPTR